MKISIGTASSNMEFEEDLKLIKSSLLYADEIELIGMAEYAVFNYLPKCLTNAKDIDDMIEKLLPLFRSFDSKETKEIEEKLCSLTQMLEPVRPYLKKKNGRNKQEILAQLKMQQVFKQCNEFLEEALHDVMTEEGTRTIQQLINKNIISVFDYSYNGFNIDELTGGYFANLLGTIKSGRSFPLFDNICSSVVKSVINEKILDFSKIDKEIIRHAGIANNILATLPTLEKASIDEILDFKKELQNPLINFRTAIYKFSEQVISMPWDINFQYECLKLYDTEVMPRINELNELSSEPGVLRNFGGRVLADGEARRKLGYFGAGLATAITTRTDIIETFGILEKYLQSGVKIGLSAAGIAAFLKTANLFKESVDAVNAQKSVIEGNVMYYYYMASKKL